MTNAQYFVLRRLHSLLGVFPLGIFLFNHLLTNSTGAVSAKFFEEKVYLIHLLGPALPLVEALVIFIPLALHIALGIYIALQARYENKGAARQYGRNWAYTFQRLTGWVALVYILYHVLHLRFLHPEISEVPFSITLGEMFYNMPWAPLIVAGYFIGGVTVIFHFANGLCTFCMSWGITSNEQSQKWVAGLASALGVALLGMLVASLIGFNRVGAELAEMNDAERQEYIEELASIHQDGH